MFIMQTVDVFADDRMATYLQQTIEAFLLECECDCCSEVLETDCSNGTAHSSYTSYLSWCEIGTDHVHQFYRQTAEGKLCRFGPYDE